MKPWMWAVLLAPIIGPIIWYALMLPGRLISRWLWRRLPDGKLRRLLFKNTGALDDSKVWPKLPPGP